MKRLILLLVAAVATSTGQDSSPTKSTLASAIFREATQCIHSVKPSQRGYAVSELAEAQAEAGLIPQAVATVSLSDRDRDQLLVTIANIEVRKGRYGSAMAIVAGIDRQQQDQVRQEIGIKQAERGDVDAAQDTAAAMLTDYYRETVLYFAALELQRQGANVRAQALASTFKYPDHFLPDPATAEPNFDWRVNRPLPDDFESIPQPPSLYSQAVQQLRAGHLTDAISRIASDSNPADASSNFARLAEDAAEMGNLDAALQLLAKVHVSGADYEDGYAEGTLRPIGKLWASMDAGAALTWARTRPTPRQRALALAGVGQGVAGSENPATKLN